MGKIANNPAAAALSPDHSDKAFNKRVFRTMAVTTVLAAGVSLIYSSWHVSAGILIGGLLALINHRWLQSSISAAFDVLVDGHKPRITLAKYIFRYLVIGTTMVLTYVFGIAPIPAIIAGMSTFVVAVFVEALRELYFSIVQREEIS